MGVSEHIAAAAWLELSQVAEECTIELHHYVHGGAMSDPDDEKDSETPVFDTFLILVATKVY